MHSIVHFNYVENLTLYIYNFVFIIVIFITIELNSLKSSLTISGPSSYPSLPSPKQRNERLSPMTASSFR